jgi:hypothetical protein
MTSSVRECLGARQAECPRTDFKLSALPQVSGAISRNMNSQDVFVIAILVLALMAAVVLTALWGKPARRRDALALLDRIIPWRG